MPVVLVVDMTSVETKGAAFGGQVSIVAQGEAIIILSFLFLRWLAMVLQRWCKLTRGMGKAASGGQDARR